MINTDKRFGILVLPYEKRDMSISKEIMIDYDEGHIYVKNKDGTRIIAITKDLQIKLDNFIQNAGDNIDVSIDGITSTTLNGALNEMKRYIDATIEGLSIKEPAKVLADKNMTLKGVPGTAIDGVMVYENDVILLNGQTNKVENGKWIVKGGAWVRTDDFNEDADLIKSAFIFIEQGTEYGDSGWVLATDGDIKIGISQLEFKIFSRAEELQAGVGLVKDGNVFSLEPITTAGTGTKVTYDKYGRIVSSQTPSSFTDLGVTDVTPLSHIGRGGSEHAVATVNNHGFLSTQDFQELKNNTRDIKDIERSMIAELSGKTEVEIFYEEPQITVGMEVAPLSIIDNVTSLDSTKALSARQGKVLYDMINNLFTNMNPDNPVTFNIWTGSLDQYNALATKDYNTLYYVQEPEQVVYTTYSTGSGGTDPSVIDELLRLINQLEIKKADRAGDTFTGTVNIGTKELPADIQVFGNMYYKNKLISEVLAPIVHKHKISEIELLEDTLSKKAALNHNHNLSTLVQDPLHRTVTDAQITQWTEGGNVNTKITEHNTSKTAHTDIRQSIDEINSRLYNDTIGMNIILEESIINSSDTTVIIKYPNFSPIKNNVMIFANTVFVSPNRYQIDGNIIRFDVTEIPIEDNTNLAVLILEMHGVSVGDIALMDIAKSQLDAALQTEITGKSDKGHRHNIAEINTLVDVLDTIDTRLNELSQAVASKASIDTYAVSTTNDFTDEYKDKIIKNEKDIASINNDILEITNLYQTIYTNSNIDQLLTTIPVSLEELCLLLPDNSILSCDSSIIFDADKPNTSGHLFIQKYSDTNVYINFYESLNNEESKMSYRDFNKLRDIKLSKWKTFVSEDELIKYGFNEVSNNPSILSAYDLPEGVYTCMGLVDSPNRNKEYQYTTTKWKDGTKIQIAIDTDNVYFRSMICLNKVYVWREWSLLAKQNDTSIDVCLNGWSIDPESVLYISKTGSKCDVTGILTTGIMTKDTCICSLPPNFVPTHKQIARVFDINSDNWCNIEVSTDGYFKVYSSSNELTDMTLMFNLSYHII